MRNNPITFQSKNKQKKKGIQFLLLLPVNEVANMRVDHLKFIIILCMQNTYDIKIIKLI